MNMAIKIFGIGKAGVRTLESLRLAGLPEVHSVAVDSDAASLAASGAAEKIHVEKKLLARLGQMPRGDFEHQVAAVKSACGGAQTVILVAGLGGRMGTQFAVAVARAARESGAHVFAFVTLPFDCEGKLHHATALHGLEQLHGLTDAVFCLSHQDAVAQIGDATHLADAFKVSAERIVAGVTHACRALASAQVIGLGFVDLCQLTWQGSPRCAFAVAEASGSNRAREIVERLLAQPALKGGEVIAGAESLMVSVVGGANVRMAEVDQVIQLLSQPARGVPHVMGVGSQADLGDRLLLMVVVARSQRATAPEVAAGKVSVANDSPASDASTELDTQLLEKQSAARPASRFVPPAPALTAEQREQLLAKQGGGRLRKHAPRLKQGSLPLEIVSKGRFDKTEPTVHKGEDLDVPTYIRRGVALN
jgi:cell division protein FtsZ